MKPIALIGIAYDKKSSFLRGPALAPPLVRQSLNSPAYNSYAESGISIDQEQIQDHGDFEIEAYFDIEHIAARFLASGNRLFTIGGDHSISYPLLKAYSKYYEDITILHIDAHPDLYQIFEGDPHAHACPFARIMEDQLCTRLVQVGIRALNPHQKAQAERFGVEQIEMRHYQTQTVPVFTNPIYISLDMDALDPAFAPGVSHQEAGGFSTREVLQLLHQIKVPIIGVDLVEFNPTRDANGITAAAAGKLTKELLALMLRNT